MEDERFDALSRTLAKPISRRRVLKTVAAMAVGGLLGEAGTRSASASQSLPCSRLPQSSCCAYCQTLFPTNPGAAVLCYVEYVDSRETRGPCACRKGGGSACVTNPARYNAYTCCSATQTCIQRICCSAHCTSCTNPTTCTTCAPGYYLSGGDCVVCPTHCTTCTSATTCTGCAPGYHVSNGKCCSTGETNCSGTCRNLSSDNNNCGTCGTVCPSGQTCCSGTCMTLSSDRNNCGACGTSCGGTCQNGTCSFCSSTNPCPTGYECHNGGCFKITNSSGSGCNSDCIHSGSVQGSSNYLCAGISSSICQSSTGCPQGQACQAPGYACLTPCG